MTKPFKIIVFDTGSGGRLFAHNLRSALGKNIVVEPVIDVAHAPYGTRSADEISVLTQNALRPYLSASIPPNLVVIACNTATAYAISDLRRLYPKINFIGFEPMLKTAAQESQTRSIAVLATPATLKSERYNQLKQQYGYDLTIYEPDCSSWAGLIDQGKLAPSLVQDTLQPIIGRPIDCVVLGCTHYVAVKDKIRQLLPQAVVLDPTLPVIRRIRSILNQ